MVDNALPTLSTLPHLIILVTTGAIAFAAAAGIFARPILNDILGLARRTRA
jgi:hypothetical protein